MPSPEPLQPERVYHIYNRGNSGEPLFREERNYRYFLKLYAHYIEPIAETYAYCLLSNHFHFLVRIKDWQSLEDCQSCPPSRAFANLLGTYTKAFNKAYQRTGSLFEKPFRRQVVDSDRYFAALIAYIHRNPQKHRFVDDFRDWAYSSYHAILSTQATHIHRAVVLGWFHGPAGFKEAHASPANEATVEPLIADDWM
jgi:REP element-mobilizing transposase RayT